MGYKFLEHTADIKVRVEATSLESAFISSAMALKEVIVEKLSIKPLIKKHIEVYARDKEGLLYNFLEEFLFLLDSQGFIFSEIKNLKITMINKKGKKLFCLKCDILGDKTKNYKMSNDVKAITYNEMKILSKESEKSKTNNKIDKTSNKNKTIIEFVLDV